MTVYVTWKGRFRDEYDDFPTARKHALLALATVAEWTPAQRLAHKEVRIVAEDGRELETFSVQDELDRVRENAKVSKSEAEE